MHLHRERLETTVNFNLNFLTEKLVRTKTEDIYTYFKDIIVEKLNNVLPLWLPIGLFPALDMTNTI